MRNQQFVDVKFNEAIHKFLFIWDNHMPHFEIYLFWDEEKHEKYSTNLCVRSRIMYRNYEL